MNRIKVLDDTIAARIAAGEVVTGPSSVVKELLENSIDAGATAITVEIVNSGRDMIRVTDNGTGIYSDDISLAVEKHATSKIDKFADLDAISTLGFRGEALFSMAAVSRFTISTRTKDSISGVVLKVSGGTNKSIIPAGLPEGTTIKVEKLFYNIPARQKFLVNSRNEAARVAAVVAHVILSNPELSIKYINNGSVTYHSPGNGRLMDSLITIYGNDISDKVIALEWSEGGISVSGYISKPSFLNKKTSNITFMLNKRYIFSKLLQDALLLGYGERLLRAHFPFAVINVNIPLDMVDVNVHPNKTQVLFFDESALHNAISMAVQNALKNNIAPELKSSSFVSLSNLEQKSTNFDIDPETKESEQIALSNKNLSDKLIKPVNVNDTKNTMFIKDEPKIKMPDLNKANWLDGKNEKLCDSSGSLYQTDRFEQIMDEIIMQVNQKDDVEQIEIQDVRELVAYTIIGQAFNTYIIVECESVLYIIDQHAAHERINYERMKKSINNGNMPSQQLLTPYIKKFSQTDFDLINDYIDVLSQLGFEVEEFGPLTYKFSAMPTQVEQAGMDKLTDEVLYEIKNNKDIVLTRDKLIQAACKHSIKAGYALADEQIAMLLNDIIKMEAMPTCPHGRPVAVAITKNELQKGFFRIV